MTSSYVDRIYTLLVGMKMAVGKDAPFYVATHHLIYQTVDLQRSDYYFKVNCSLQKAYHSVEIEDFPVVSCC